MMLKNALNKKKIKEQQNVRKLEEEKLNNDLKEKENRVTQIKNGNIQLDEKLQAKRLEVARKDKELLVVKTMIVNILKDRVFDIDLFKSVSNDCVSTLNDFNEAQLQLYAQEVEYNLAIRESETTLNYLKEEIDDIKEKLATFNASS
jgi:hypothetical protein